MKNVFVKCSQLFSNYFSLTSEEVSEHVPGEDHLDNGEKNSNPSNHHNSSLRAVTKYKKRSTSQPIQLDLSRCPSNLFLL